jgi:hypothetical protein
MEGTPERTPNLADFVPLFAMESLELIARMKLNKGTTVPTVDRTESRAQASRFPKTKRGYLRGLNNSANSADKIIGTH